MKFIFVIGYQKYYMEFIQRMNKEQLNMMRTIIKNPKNYVFFVNYAFTRKEYDKFGEGLPECILEEGDSTFLSDDVIDRVRACVGQTAVVHIKSKDVVTNSNPNFEHIMNEALLKIGDEDGRSELDGVEIFGLTDNSSTMRNLIKYIREFDLIQKSSILVH